MKLTVQVYLNVRVGSASLNAPCYQYLSPGSVIEVEERPYKGDPYEGIDTWYRDPANNYYWSGGFANGAKADYRQAVSYVDPAWIGTDAKDTTIAIIDSGLHVDNLHFSSETISEIDLTDNSVGEKNHGTFIGGIIAGSNAPIRGVCSKAALVSLRYKHSNTPLASMFANLQSALDQVKKIGEGHQSSGLVVNLSQAFNKHQCELYPDNVKAITGAIQELTRLGAVVVCAAGENGDLTDDGLLYPGHLDETVAVGCITQDRVGIPSSSCIDVVTPYVEYESYDSSFNVAHDSGSSFSTAVITGLVALILSNKRSLGSPAMTKALIKQELLRFSVPKSGFHFDKSSPFQYSITT